MRFLEGRVAIVTGAGRGLGRGYAQMLASHGAAVVVNDVDPDSARTCVEEITTAGGSAMASGADVADWDAAAALVQQAVDRFGRLDVLINNAGILRDRMLVNMTEEEWDAVIRVNLKGTFAPTHHAANHWRAEHKAGRPVDARIINTTSHSGLFANIGQTNYGAAKAGVAGFTQIAARELARIGVTVNAVAPRADTQLTPPGGNDDPAHRARRQPIWAARLVTWLASAESADISGRVFEAWGYRYAVLDGWRHGPETMPAEDPTTLGPAIHAIVAAAAPNAGIDRGTEHVP